MTKSEAKAIMNGSMILYLLDSLLPKKEQGKATVIRLKQVIRGKIIKKEYKPLVMLSNFAWDDTIQAFQGKNYKILIYDLIETIVDKEKESMNSFYGNHFTDVVFRYSIKNGVCGLDSELYKESREVSVMLVKQIQKVLHDNKGVWDGI